LKASENFETSSPGIRVLCPTRWTVRADALQSVLLREESTEFVKVSDMGCRIRGVMTYMNKWLSLWLSVGWTVAPS
jgi:hypothetical protein